MMTHVCHAETTLKTQVRNHENGVQLYFLVPQREGSQKRE